VHALTFLWPIQDGDVTSDKNIIKEVSASIFHSNFLNYFLSAPLTPIMFTVTVLHKLVTVLDDEFYCCD